MKEQLNNHIKITFTKNQVKKFVTYAKAHYECLSFATNFNDTFSAASFAFAIEGVRYESKEEGVLEISDTGGYASFKNIQKITIHPDMYDWDIVRVWVYELNHTGLKSYDLLAYHKE